MYATGSDLIERYDARVLGDLLADDNTSVALADVPTHPKVLVALTDAAGDIDAALMAGERYSRADLEALAGPSRALLTRITCEIAATYLEMRRMTIDVDKLTALKELAERTLNRLRKGEIVFNLAPQKDAGLPDAPLFTQVDADRSHLLRDRVKNYFPRRRFPVR